MEFCIRELLIKGVSINEIPQTLLTKELISIFIKLSQIKKEPSRKESIIEDSSRNIIFYLKIIPIHLHTTELYIIALNLDAYNLKYIPTHLLTTELNLIAMQRNGMTLRYVPYHLLNAEVCYRAVQQNGLALQFVPEYLKTAKLCLAAVQQTGMALEYVIENLSTAEICFTAVNQNGLALEHVPYNLRSVEICFTAAKQNYKCIDFIPNIIHDDLLYLPIINIYKNMCYQDITYMDEYHHINKRIIKMSIYRESQWYAFCSTSFFTYIPTDIKEIILYNYTYQNI